MLETIEISCHTGLTPGQRSMDSQQLSDIEMKLMNASFMTGCRYSQCLFTANTRNSIITHPATPTAVVIKLLHSTAITATFLMDSEGI